MNCRITGPALGDALYAIVHQYRSILHPLGFSERRGGGHFESRPGEGARSNPGQVRVLRASPGRVREQSADCRGVV
jgi:hypothetical protein